MCVFSPAVPHSNSPAAPQTSASRSSDASKRPAERSETAVSTDQTNHSTHNSIKLWGRTASLRWSREDNIGVPPVRYTSVHCTEHAMRVIYVLDTKLWGASCDTSPCLHPRAQPDLNLRRMPPPPHTHTNRSAPVSSSLPIRPEGISSLTCFGAEHVVHVSDHLARVLHLLRHVAVLRLKRRQTP